MYLTKGFGFKSKLIDAFFSIIFNIDTIGLGAEVYYENWYIDSEDWYRSLNIDLHILPFELSLAIGKGS